MSDIKAAVENHLENLIGRRDLLEIDLTRLHEEIANAENPEWVKVLSAELEAKTLEFDSLGRQVDHFGETLRKENLRIENLRTETIGKISEIDFVVDGKIVSEDEYYFARNGDELPAEIETCVDGFQWELAKNFLLDEMFSEFRIGKFQT